MDYKKEFETGTFVAVDIETTGLDAEIHEVIQIGMMPLTKDGCCRHDDRLEIRLRAMHPETADPESLKMHGKDITAGYYPSKAGDLIETWINSCEIGKIIPFGYKWEFDKKFLIELIGKPRFDDLFSRVQPDFLHLAWILDIRSFMIGEPLPFPDSCSLVNVLRALELPYTDSHDAMDDVQMTVLAAKSLMQIW